MAKSIGILDITFIAGATMTGNIFYAVKKDTTANQVVLAGDGDPVLGLLQNKPDLGQAAIVRVYGESQAITGANDVAEGDQVAADSLGKVDTATSGEHVMGICIESGNHTSGRIATVLLLPQGKA